MASSGVDVLRSRATDTYVVKAVLAGLNLAMALEETVRDSNVHELAATFCVTISVYVFLRLGFASRASIIASNIALRFSSSSR
jgi:hypothetical protein